MIGIGLVPQIGSWNSLAHSYGIMLLVFDSNGMIGLCYEASGSAIGTLFWQNCEVQVGIGFRIAG